MCRITSKARPLIYSAVFFLQLQDKLADSVFEKLCRGERDIEVIASRTLQNREAAWVVYEKRTFGARHPRFPKLVEVGAIHSSIGTSITQCRRVRTAGLEAELTRVRSHVSCKRGSQLLAEQVGCKPIVIRPAEPGDPVCWVRAW